MEGEARAGKQLEHASLRTCEQAKKRKAKPKEKGWKRKGSSRRACEHASRRKNEKQNQKLIDWMRWQGAGSVARGAGSSSMRTCDPASRRKNGKSKAKAN